ncbi:hypothetical protein ACTFIU_002133 [Dictyostelium citrinum]
MVGRTNTSKELSNNLQLIPSIKHDISNSCRVSNKIHNQENRPVCFAHALATCIRSTYSRICGRYKPCHIILVSKIESNYPNFRESNINELAKEYQIEMKSVQFIRVFDIVESGVPIYFSFGLNREGWKNFSKYTNDIQNKKTIFDFKKEYIENPDPITHAVVIIGYDEELNCFLIKNSWGEDKANSGYIYISPAHLEMMNGTYIYFYFTINNLTKGEKDFFELQSEVEKEKYNQTNLSINENIIPFKKPRVTNHCKDFQRSKFLIWYNKNIAPVF